MKIKVELLTAGSNFSLGTFKTYGEAFTIAGEFVKNNPARIFNIAYENKLLKLEFAKL